MFLVPCMNTSAQCVDEFRRTNRVYVAFRVLFHHSRACVGVRSHVQLETESSVCCRFRDWLVFFVRTWLCYICVMIIELFNAKQSFDTEPDPTKGVGSRRHSSSKYGCQFPKNLMHNTNDAKNSLEYDEMIHKESK